MVADERLRAGQGGGGRSRVGGVGLKTRLRHYLNLHRTKARLTRLLTDFEWDRVDRVFDVGRLKRVDAPALDAPIAVRPAAGDDAPRWDEFVEACPEATLHANARALVPTERQLSDRQIRLIAERDGVIGIVLYNAFIQAGWRKGQAKDLVTLDNILAHIDHICQTIGDATHVGIGSDLDGGFGANDIPNAPWTISPTCS